MENLNKLNDALAQVHNLNFWIGVLIIVIVVLIMACFVLAMTCVILYQDNKIMSADRDVMSDLMAGSEFESIMNGGSKI